MSPLRIVVWSLLLAAVLQSAAAFLVSFPGGPGVGNACASLATMAAFFLATFFLEVRKPWYQSEARLAFLVAVTASLPLMTWGLVSMTHQLIGKIEVPIVLGVTMLLLNLHAAFICLTSAYQQSQLYEAEQHHGA